MPSAESPYVGTPNNIVAVLGGLAARWVTYGLIIVLPKCPRPPTESIRTHSLDRTVQTCATQLQRLGDASADTVDPAALSAIYLLIGGVLLLSWHRPYQDWVASVCGGRNVRRDRAGRLCTTPSTRRPTTACGPGPDSPAPATIAVVMGALIVYIAARIF